MKIRSYYEVENCVDSLLPLYDRETRENLGYISGNEIYKIWEESENLEEFEKNVKFYLGLE